MPVPQLRQRPRRRSHDMTGMLSYHAISVPHDMHADGGETIERFSGTRAATTFRNDPTARAGKNAIPATASPTWSPLLRRVCADRGERCFRLRLAHCADAPELLDPLVDGGQRLESSIAVPPTHLGAGDDPRVLVEPVLDVPVGGARVLVDPDEKRAGASSQRDLVQRLAPAR